MKTVISKWDSLTLIQPLNKMWFTYDRGYHPSIKLSLASILTGIEEHEIETPDL